MAKSKTPPGVTVANEGKESAHWVVDKQINGKRYKASSKRYRGDYLNATDWNRSNQEWFSHFVESIRRTREYGERPKRTFLDGVERYVASLAGSKSSIKETIRLLTACCEHLGGADLREVSQDHSGVQRIVRQLRESGRKNQTINNHYTAIRAVLNYAAGYRGDEGITWLLAAPKFKLLPTTDQRLPRVLLWEEQPLLLTALPTHLAQLGLFILNTGLRDSEACGLTRENLVLGELTSPSYLLIQRKKNNQKMPVVLNTTALAIAKDMLKVSKAVGTQHLFTYNGNPINRINNTAWKKWVQGKVSKLDGETGLYQTENFEDGLGLDLRVHDLRHTFGHRLLEAGCPEEIRRTMMGHKSSTVTQHYAQASLELMLRYSEAASVQTGVRTPYLRVV